MTIEITAKRCCGGETITTSEPSADARKEFVQRTYAAAASARSGCGCADDTSFVGDSYDTVEGYVAEADLGLGCGLPTEIADLSPGETVLDLGSGAGIDAFVARSIVGAEGRVIGVDFTPEMIARARENASDLSYENVSFIEAEIEALPLPDRSVDVVVSNCVLNLVPDKARAFSEMYRVIRPGGRFCISDIVLEGVLPDRIRASAEAYAGCVSGAIDRKTYLHALVEAGFHDVEIRRSRPIEIPDSLMTEVQATEAEIADFRAGGGILSVTVTGRRV